MDAEKPDDLVIEFKPKWLAQSPNAPPMALRCRNCAREAYRAIKSNRPDMVIFCPLHLVNCHQKANSDTAALDRIAEYMTSGKQPSPSQLERLRQWLKSNSLVPHLRADLRCISGG